MFQPRQPVDGWLMINGRLMLMINVNDGWLMDINGKCLVGGGVLYRETSTCLLSMGNHNQQ